ncbi:MAG: hydrogen peroxide-inducible genes activator [Terriglobales bacterium]
MEVHQLRYFCAVARAGNFTRAAAAEGVAQPSLSQQILKLEDELGARLFDRLSRFARLTDFGAAFLPSAHAILRQIAEAHEEIQEMQGSEKGTMTLGAIPTVAPYLLPGVLGDFARAFPHVSLNVQEEITPVLLERLHAATLDFAIVALPVPGDELESVALLREPLFAALPRRHRLASRDSLRLADLKGEPFLLLKEGHCFRESALAACRRSRVSPNVVFESGQFQTILAMVASGMGVSVVPSMAKDAHSGCRFVRITDERSYRRIGAVRLKHHYMGKAQAVFWGFLKQRAAR